MGWAWVPVGWATPTHPEAPTPEERLGCSCDRRLRRATGSMLVGDDTSFPPPSPAWDPSMNMDMPNAAAPVRRPGMFDRSAGPWFASDDASASDRSGYSSGGSAADALQREPAIAPVSAPPAVDGRWMEPVTMEDLLDSGPTAELGDETAPRRGAWDECLPSDSG